MTWLLSSVFRAAWGLFLPTQSHPKVRNTISQPEKKQQTNKEQKIPTQTNQTKNPNQLIGDWKYSVFKEKMK